MDDATGRTRGRTARLELLGWSAVALVLSVFAVPWFLWRDSTVVAGLPLWIWWHVGWMALASVVFYLFTRYGWGVGVVPTEPDERSPDGEQGGSVAGEVNRRG